MDMRTSTTKNSRARKITLLMLTLIGAVYFGGASAPTTVASTPNVKHYVAASVTTNIYDLDKLINVVTPPLEMWGKSVVTRRGYRYQSPKVIIFNRKPNSRFNLRPYSPCSAVPDFGGAEYCPKNKTIYLDYQFLNQALLTIGDNAAASVYVHEYGHHLQWIGRWGAWELERPASSVARELQEQLIERQADCFVGVFNRYANNQKLLSPGDLTEAERIFDRDDEPPYLRKSWFRKGYNGDITSSCSIK